MKQNILILCLILILSSCNQVSVEENDISAYNKYHKEKQKMAQEYYNLMQSPAKNKNKIKKYDQKIHEINKNLKRLSMKEHVRDYLRIQFLKKQINARSAGESSIPIDSENLNPDDFDYYMDNLNVDADYDFSNKEFADTTSEDESFENDNETVSDNNEYIQPEEGVYMKDVSEEVDGEMESADEENIDAEYEFEEFDEQNE